MVEQAASYSEIRRAIKRLMWREVGLTRNAAGLAHARDELIAIGQQLAGPVSRPEHLEVVNLQTVGLLISSAALLRKESRGGHFREDFPTENDSEWLKHIVLQGDQLTLVDQKRG
jgi:L-aspartate oxidase